MTVKTETSVFINRPVEAIFEFMANPENDTLWQSGVLESRKTSKGPMGAGTTEESETQFLGRRIRSTFVVMEYEPHRKIEYKTISGPLELMAAYILDPHEGGDTKVTFIAEGDVSGFFKLAEPLFTRMAQRQWETNLATLKDLLESRAEGNA